MAVASGRRVVKLNTGRKQAVLSDGTVITYDRCLLAGCVLAQFFLVLTAREISDALRRPAAAAPAG